MAKLTPDQIKAVKGQGFLINRGTDCFSGRIVSAAGEFTADQLSAMAEVARRYGDGRLINTARQCVELPGIPYDKIPEAKTYLDEHGCGIAFGGTGAKIRPVVSCKGTTCVYGNCDTLGIARRIHEEYYLGKTDLKLPHKFKIAVGGCPNSCMKPSINDFGIEGHRVPVIDTSLCHGCPKCAVEASCPSKVAHVIDGKISIGEGCLACGVCTGKCPFGAIAKQTETVYQIYVGGTWGKKRRTGTPLSHMVTEDEIWTLLDRSLVWFAENANAGERFGAAIDRVGIDKLEAYLFA